MIRQYKKIIALVILITIMMPSSAFAEDPASEAFPSVKELFNGDNDNIYLTKYKDNYYLDMEEYVFFKEPEGLVNVAANILFKIQVYLGYALVTLIYYAYEMPIYDMFSDVVDQVVSEMETALFDELSLIAIVLLGLYFAIKMAAEQRTQIWVAIIQVIIVIALATAFYKGPSGMLDAINEGTNGISKAVLAGTYRATNEGQDPDSAVMAAANNTWYMFVHRPWQILEFGSVEMAKKHEDEILSLPSLSDARQVIIDELAEDEVHFTSDWGIKRVGYLLFSFIPYLILFLIIAVLCLLIWAYKFLTITFILLGIFVFICALIPMLGGIRILQSWLSKVIGSAAITVVVSFFLAIVFAFNTVLYGFIDEYGIFVVVIVQLVIAAVIFFKRESLFELFTMARLAASGAYPVNKQMRRDTNIENRVMEYSRNLNLRRNKNSSYYDEESKDEINSSGSNTSEGSIRNSAKAYNTTNKARQTGIPNSDKGLERQTVGFGDLYDEIQEDTKSDNENFKELMKKAENILEKQYELLGKTAEEKAEKLGKEPKHHPFVYKVQTREALGAKKFDDREVIAVAKQLQRTINAGGSAEDLVKGFENSKDFEVSRPKNLIEIKIGEESYKIDRDEAKKIEIKDISKEYADEFNKDHNKNYDPQFMEEIIKKYGHTQVRYMLDKMKEIQLKEKSINNPAGYMIKGLKNNHRDSVGKKTPEGNINMRGNKDEDG